MPFTTPLKLQLLHEDSVYPWLTLEPFCWLDPDTSAEYCTPAYFRTDGASNTLLIGMIPMIGMPMLMRMFATGMFKGFKPGVIHDYLRRKVNGKRPVPTAEAHRLLKKMMVECDYPADVIAAYYAAVVLFDFED